MKKNLICDIDGVILHNNDLIPGADRFVHRLLEQGSKLLFLTNYPAQTQKDLQNRFRSTGIEVPEECFYTSAMGTADFLKRQDGKKAYVIGEGALTHELYKAGFTITDIDPDFVVVGETRNYNWTMMQLGAKFVDQGARFIATNPDTHGPMMHPACGALCAPIERMTGKKPFYVGKPSAWIIRAARTSSIPARISTKCMSARMVNTSASFSSVSEKPRPTLRVLSKYRSAPKL